MRSETELKDIVVFIADYAATLLGSGVHTSRVVRNSRRIGDSLGVKVNMTIFQKTIILTISDHNMDNFYTEVVDIPALPISFEYNSELSALSWLAYDRDISLETLREEFKKIVSKPKMSPYIVLLLVSFANTSFCRLFGGDIGAMLIVFIATLLGFFTRQQLQKRKVNHFVVFTVSAFVASMCASVSLLFAVTAEIAIGTSVLFLIPGVPLINGVIDIVEGHTLIGFSRLMQAILLIICISVGLSCPLLFFKNSLL
jgi:uncharacterized membrane protein YjjP (DUF1212 family)